MALGSQNWGTMSKIFSTVPGKHLQALGFSCYYLPITRTLRSPILIKYKRNKIISLYTINFAATEANKLLLLLTWTSQLSVALHDRWPGCAKVHSTERWSLESETKPSNTHGLLDAEGSPPPDTASPQHPRPWHGADYTLDGTRGVRTRSGKAGRHSDGAQRMPPVWPCPGYLTSGPSVSLLVGWGLCTFQSDTKQDRLWKK